MTFTCSPTISLEGIRCYSCGRWWAKENRPARCPYCAEDKVDRRQTELDAAHRTIAALRGALTRAKRVAS